MFRCVEKFTRGMNPRTGLMQEIVDYSCKNGKKGTEITTYLNKKGTKKIIKTIERDTFGNPEQVLEQTASKIEIYKPNVSGRGIDKLYAGKVQCYYPEKTLAQICQY